MNITNTTIIEAYSTDKGWHPINKPISEDLLIDLMNEGVVQVYLDAEGFEHSGDYGVNEAFTLLHKTNYEQGIAFARLGDVSV